MGQWWRFQWSHCQDRYVLGDGSPKGGLSHISRTNAQASKTRMIWIKTDKSSCINMQSSKYTIKYERYRHLCSTQISFDIQCDIPMRWRKNWNEEYMVHDIIYISANRRSIELSVVYARCFTLSHLHCNYEFADMDTSAVWTYSESCVGYSLYVHLFRSLVWGLVRFTRAQAFIFPLPHS